MVILPLAVKEGILNFEVTLKGVNKRSEILQADKIQLPAKDISIGKIQLQNQKNSSYYDKNPEALTQFIRKIASYNERIKVIYVTTDNYENTEFYDVYKLPLPPREPNILVDFLYGFLVNDIRLQVPAKEKGKELSFKKLGLDDLLKDDTLEEIEHWKEDGMSRHDFLLGLQQAGYKEQLQVMDFLNTLNFERVNDADIPYSTLEKWKRVFATICDQKRVKSIQKLQTLAQDNYDGYVALNTLNNILYNKPFMWSSEQKILQKRNAS